MNKLLKFIRRINYELFEVGFRGNDPGNKPLTFEEFERLKEHKHSFQLRRTPNDPNIKPEYRKYQDEMYICDNPLCGMMVPKDTIDNLNK